jgi:hypothetical protein
MATTSTIKQLTNKDGELISPFTTEAAVYDAEGKRLNVKLTELQQGHEDNSEKIDKLLDSVFPISISLNVSTSSDVDSDTLQWSVTENNRAFSPDSVIIKKNDEVLYDGNDSAGSVESSIDTNALYYKATASKDGRTDAVKSVQRFIIHYGASDLDSVDSSTISTLIGSLNHGEIDSPSFNAKIKTSLGEYIWIIVPNALYINKVVSDGFEVTLQSDLNEVTYNGNTYGGTYYAYRTLNALSENTWDLTIAGTVLKGNPYAQ